MKIFGLSTTNKVTNASETILYIFDYDKHDDSHFGVSSVEMSNLHPVSTTNPLWDNGKI